MSRCLTERSIDHVVIERGEVANSWRTERWDSLRLLTPNWQSRLPGFGYDGDDPDGYRTMPEVIDFLDRYASVISAPVQTNTNVTSVSAADSGFVVATDQGHLALPNRCARNRRLQCRAGSRRRRGGAARDRHHHLNGLPQSRST